MPAQRLLFGAIRIYDDLILDALFAFFIFISIFKFFIFRVTNHRHELLHVFHTTSLSIRCLYHSNTWKQPKARLAKAQSNKTLKFSPKGSPSFKVKVGEN